MGTKKYSLDKGWKFHNGDIPAPFINSHTKTYMAAKAGGAIGAASPDFDKSGWTDIDLPHDYAVANDIDEKYGPAAGYKKRGKAWYSKRFRLDESDRTKQILIEFEGITGECTVYLNGSVIGRNFSGYNSFTVDATDMALYGDNINDLTIRVDADLIEGWWYEGAGIYRHVNLYKKEMLHFEHNGVFFEPVKMDTSTWCVYTQMTVGNMHSEDERFEIVLSLTDKDGNEVGKASDEFLIEGERICYFRLDFFTYSPQLWDIDDPCLYRATAEIRQNGTVIDSFMASIGFRTMSIDAEKGFFLNGRRIKLFGTCNHQDHAGVGVAVPDSVNEYRIKLLKEMGSNAYRAAHGNASKAILDACDKYGILVMDENRQYNTAETDGLKQVRDMVLRDRNHPSVVMYSLFNEEPLQGTYTGRKLAKRLRAEVERLDGTRFTLGAMNNGLLSEDGAYDICDITGINYQTNMYDAFHSKFPNMPVVGSENCSAFMTRGCYKTDHSQQLIDSFDSECAPWGNTYRDGFKQIIERDYIMGYFVWTGFDYRGEPTPFAYPSISTQFGIMDTCGFRKSAYYLNKSFWTNEKLVHIASHWNHCEGETVHITVFTNCDETELLVNGECLGKQKTDKFNTAEFDVKFIPGELTVRAADGSASDTVYTCSGTASLELSAGDKTVYRNDAICINARALDENGHFVFNACDQVRFIVEGGTVLGVGNGDPNSHEADKSDTRRLYNGCCQAVITPSDDAEIVTVTAETTSGIKSVITIPVSVKENEPEYIPSVREKYLTKWRQTLELSNEYPDWSVEISDSDMNTWVVVSVGNGYDDIYNGKTGYAMYKTKTTVNEGEHIVFCELFGDLADVYINGEKVFSSPCPYGKRFEYVCNITGEISITVVIESRQISEPAGISKPVIVSD